MKKKVLSIIAMLAMTVSMAACGGGEAPTPPPTDGEGGEEVSSDAGDLITVGYAQVGAESDWRTANTESFKSTFTEENGYKLIFDDAQQKQENQIKAIRSFIQQDVDYIVVAPVVETGGKLYWKKQKKQASRSSFLTV